MWFLQTILQIQYPVCTCTHTHTGTQGKQDGILFSTKSIFIIYCIVYNIIYCEYIYNILIVNIYSIIYYNISYHIILYIYNCI